MKKITLLVLLALLIIPIGVSAKTQKATLILPETGTLKVVEIDSPQANHYFELGYHLYSESLIGASFAPTTAYSQRLSSSISSTATSSILVSSVLDRDGIALPLTSTNKGYFTIEPGVSAREESIVCTGVNTTTVALTGCTRGLLATGTSETGSSTLAFAHNAGSKIIMTDIAQFFGNFVDIWNDQDIAGIKNYSSSPLVPSPTTDLQAVNKVYVDNLVASGVATSTPTTFGGGKLSTRLEASNGIYDANDPKFLYSGIASSSPQIATSSVMMSESDGKLNIGYIDFSEAWTRTGDTTLASTTITADLTMASSSVSGLMNFTGDLPTASTTPTTDNQLTRKKYIDDKEDVWFEVIASANLRSSADTSRSTASSTYFKLKEIQFNNVSGAITTKFDLANGAGSGSSCGRVYKNGIAVGTEECQSSATPITKSENFAVVDGDLIQIYAKVVTSGPAEISDFRLYYDKEPVYQTDTIVTD